MDPQISQLLIRWSNGDYSARDQLAPLVYEELRRIGRRHLSNRPEQSVIQPTVLIHEAWIKLAAREKISLANRNQFYALVAKVMRDVLVDHVRSKRAAKHAGNERALSIDANDVAVAASPVDIIQLDEVLRRLAEIKPRYVQLVELKFFAGLTIEECAQALNISTATVEREWNVARAWLRRELYG